MPPRFLTEAELGAIYDEPTIERLADRDGSGTADEDAVEGAILDAEDEALSHLLGRFSDSEIPATTGDTSRYLKVLVAGIAYYNLHRHWDSNPGKAIAEYDRAIKGLESIRIGQLSAVLTGSPEVDSGRGVVASIRRHPTLDEETISLASMRDWGHR